MDVAVAAVGGVAADWGIEERPVSLFFWGTHPRHQSRQQLILTKSTKLLARPSGTPLLSPWGSEMNIRTGLEKERQWVATIPGRTGPKDLLVVAAN